MDFCSQSKQPRSTVISQDVSGSWAVRTPAWFLQSRNDAESTTELYAKPDDRWEVNNVAERCQDVVRAMEQLYKDARDGKPTEPIDHLLR